MHYAAHKQYSSSEIIQCIHWHELLFYHLRVLRYAFAVASSRRGLWEYLLGYRAPIQHRNRVRSSHIASNRSMVRPVHTYRMLLACRAFRMCIDLVGLAANQKHIWPQLEEPLFCPSLKLSYTMCGRKQANTNIERYIGHEPAFAVECTECAEARIRGRAKTNMIMRAICSERAGPVIAAGRIHYAMCARNILHWTPCYFGRNICDRCWVECRPLAWQLQLDTVGWLLLLLQRTLLAVAR